MIKSFLNKGLRRFWEQDDASRLATVHVGRTRMILQALEVAERPSAMNLPGLRWHPLGDMAPGRYAVKVSGNWRITYAWKGSDAVDVDLEDYH